MAKKAKVGQPAQVPLDVQNSHAIKRLEETIAHITRKERLAIEDNEAFSPVHVLNTAGAIGGACAPKAPHEGTISRLMQELNSDQSGTHALVDKLLEKLKPILGPETPAAVGNAPPALLTYCLAGDALQNHLEAQRAINMRLAMILDRIAL